MAVAFDPYHKWLGIPPSEQPPTYYRLLALNPFESDPDVIEAAADARMAHLRSLQTGQHAELTQKLLNQISTAKLCLLKADKRAAYDAALHARYAAQAVAAAGPPPPAIPDESEIEDPAPDGLDSITEQEAVAVVDESDPLGLHSPSSGGYTPRPYVRRRQKSSGPLLFMIGAPILGIVAVAAAIMIHNSQEPAPGDEGTGSEKVASTTNGSDNPHPKPPGPANPKPKEGGSPQGTSNPTHRESVYLDDLHESSAEVGRGLLGKHGQIGYDITPDRPKRFRWEGGDVEHALSIYASRNGVARITYKLDGKYRSFSATAAIFEVNSPEPKTPLQFRVLRGDGRLLWSTNKPLRRKGESENCQISLEGVELLKLEVFCPGDNSHGHAVWINPQFSTLPATSGPSGSDVASDKSHGGDSPNPPKDPRDQPGPSDTSSPRPDFQPPDGSVDWAALTTHSARVTVRGMSSTALQESADRDGWRKVPFNLADLRATIYSNRTGKTEGARADIEVREGGFVLLACNFDDPGDNGGEGKKDAWTADKFRDNGWKQIADVALGGTLIKGDGRPQVVFFKQLQQGDRLALRCNKVDPPYVIVFGFKNSNPAEPVADTRGPVPDAAAQQKALAQLKEVFKNEYAKTNTADGNLALAKRLGKLASEEKSDTVARYVMAMQGLELAVRGGDVQLASEFIGGLNTYYQIDAWNMKAKALAQLSHTVKTAEGKAQVARTALDLAEQALADERCDAALDLAGAAGTIAAVLADQPLRDQVRDLRERARKLKILSDEAKAARAKLATAPDDPEANLNLGRYLCLLKNNWTEGLPYLLKGSDPVWKDIAKQENGNFTEPDDQVKLADAWWDAAEKRVDKKDDPWRKLMQARAIYWYREAMPNLTGLKLAKAKTRTGDDGPSLVKPIDPAVQNVYLDDLTEAAAKIGYGTLGKHGETGYSEESGEPRHVRLNGNIPVHALSMHPPLDGFSEVTYSLDGNFKTFTATVAIMESRDQRNPAAVVVFRVVGDGKPLWTSRDFRRQGDNMQCTVPMQGVKTLALQVACKGINNAARAAWIDPQLSK